MVFNYYSKAVILLALLALMASMASAASPKSLRRRELDKDQHDKGNILLKRTKGKDGDPDEITLQVKVHKCEEDSNACKKLKEKGMEVTGRQFRKSLADDLLAALEKDEKDDAEDGNNDEKDDNSKHEKMLPLPACFPLITCDSTYPYNCYEYDYKCSYY